MADPLSIYPIFVSSQIYPPTPIVTQAPGGFQIEILAPIEVALTSPSLTVEVLGESGASVTEPLEVTLSGAPFTVETGGALSAEIE